LLDHWTRSIGKISSSKVTLKNYKNTSNSFIDNNKLNENWSIGSTSTSKNSANFSNFFSSTTSSAETENLSVEQTTVFLIFI
jgi:hypothetical protein